jgi:3-deoxy-D-manno-octulosonic-acid transferase
MFIWLIYNLLLPPLFLAGLPFYAVRMIRRGGVTYQWRERLGGFGKGMEQFLETRPGPVWIHAVSVGEVKMAACLIREIHARRPGQGVILSTTTITGRRLAESLDLPDTRVIFHVLDFWPCVQRALHTVRPSLVVLIEQELWPNLLFACRARNVPVWLLNGRLSDRSWKRFRTFRRILRPPLSLLDLVGLQHEADLERFREAGFPSHKCFVTGSMKFDVVAATEGNADQNPASTLLSELGWSREDPVLLCGSTHAPEEEFLSSAFRKLKTGSGAGPLRIILVPRHAERGGELERRVQQLGFAVVRKSALSGKPLESSPDVLLVDTTGELATLYGLGTINLIGKSFLGVGGQNFLEAVCHGRPVVVGPEMSNFRDTVARFRQEGALVQLDSNEDLVAVLQDLLDHPERAQETGRRGKKLLEELSGAAGIQAEMICTLVGSNH